MRGGQAAAAAATLRRRSTRGGVALSRACRRWRPRAHDHRSEEISWQHRLAYGGLVDGRRRIHCGRRRCRRVRISNSSGVWVHSQDKVGKDAGELAGGDPIGVAATNDADALIALRPDCVVYAASGPERDAGAVPDYLRLLEAGINVVSTTSTSLVYPPAYYSPDWRDQLEAAAKSGNASFYASGIFPGFGSDQLALLLATQSKKIRVHQGHRDRAERPLPGGRRDDERDGVRSSARLRADAQDSRIHRNGLEGTDLPDGRRPRCRGRGGPRLTGPAY